MAYCSGHGEELDYDRKYTTCPNCAAPVGTYHHIFCDVEKMPRDAMKNIVFDTRKKV